MANLCYCNTCQQPKNIDELKFSFVGNGICVEKNEFVAAEAHNAVIDALQDIHNYGPDGDRDMPKPSVLNLQKVAMNEIYTTDMYNALLETIDDDEHTIMLDIGATKGETYITGYYFKELENYINNIYIDANRCDGCNICNSCNGCMTDAELCVSCYVGCLSDCHSGDYICGNCQWNYDNCQGSWDDL